MTDAAPDKARWPALGLFRLVSAGLLQRLARGFGLLLTIYFGGKVSFPLFFLGNLSLSGGTCVTDTVRIRGSHGARTAIEPNDPPINCFPPERPSNTENDEPEDDG